MPRPAKRDRGPQPEPGPAADAVERYRRLRPTYLRYAEALKSLLQQLLHDSGIAYVTLETRAKTVEGFQEKAHRGHKGYEDPLAEITDLAGLRVVLYHTNEMATVAGLVEAAFEVDWENSVDKTETIDPDRFGYRSTHYVVRLRPDRRELPENRVFADLRAEIQIRTVLQHAWAAIDHKLRYKTTADVPRQIRRRLFRVSALLELADSEFAALQEQTDLLRADYGREVDEGNLDLEVDSDSLAAYADAAAVVADISGAAGLAGCTLLPAHPAMKTPEFSGLVALLDALAVKRIGQLEALLKAFSPEAQTALAAVVAAWERSERVHKNATLHLTRDALLRMAVLLASPPQSAVAALARVKFGSVLTGAVTSLIDGGEVR